MRKLLFLLLCLTLIGMVLVMLSLPYWFAIQGNEYIDYIFLTFCSDKAKTYYAVLSSVFGVLFATAGVFLGYFYYINRNRFEVEIKEREKRRARLDVFIQELNEYDICVQRILNMSFADERELNRIRADKERHFEIIEDMMEQLWQLLCFSKEDMATILRVISFVDKADMISHEPISTLKKDLLMVKKDDYVELIRKARRVCFLHLC